MIESHATLYLAVRDVRVWMALDMPSKCLVGGGTLLSRSFSDRAAGSGLKLLDSLEAQQGVVSFKPLQIAGPHYAILEPEVHAIAQALAAIAVGKCKSENVAPLARVIQGAVDPALAYELIRAHEKQAVTHRQAPINLGIIRQLENVREETRALRSGKPIVPPMAPNHGTPHGSGMLSW